MSLFFNADYESQLFSDKVEIISNAMNQELEYFLFFLEKSSIYSLKDYDHSYIKHVETLGAKAETTKNRSNIKCWWGSYQNLELSRLLNSKITSTQLAIKYGLAHKETKISQDLSLIKENYLFKDPTGVSGRGIYTSKNIKKVQSLMRQRPLIIEPILNRKMDFSYLYIDDQSDLIYQNEVDDYFQYKGTTIGYFNLSDEIQLEFLNAIKIVKNYIQEKNVNSPWSMDAFIYQEDARDKLYALSEINHRKTMGLITYKLHQQWNKNGVSKLILIPQSSFSNQIDYINSPTLKMLSPLGNRFHCFFLLAESIEHLNNIQNEFTNYYGVKV